jgi:hypothetical protein
MNTYAYRFALPLLITAALSCSDQGDVVNFLEVVDLTPAPNSTNVDKARYVTVHFNRGVGRDQSRLVQLRYVDDTSSVNCYAGCGMTPFVDGRLCTGPFLWKPGRTVEVTIPTEVSDPEGNSLRQSLTYRFTVARDTLPFDLVDARPAQNDTFSLSTNPSILFGSLTFNDYTFVRESVLTIDPPATLWMSVLVICDGRYTPFRQAWFTIRNLQPYTTYTITVPRTIQDYEGETLPSDRYIVFHTKP